MQLIYLIPYKTTWNNRGYKVFIARNFSMRTGSPSSWKIAKPWHCGSLSNFIFYRGNRTLICWYSTWADILILILTFSTCFTAFLTMVQNNLFPPISKNPLRDCDSKKGIDTGDLHPWHLKCNLEDNSCWGLVSECNNYAKLVKFVVYRDYGFVCCVLAIDREGRVVLSCWSYTICHQKKFRQGNSFRGAWFVMIRCI